MDDEEKFIRSAMRVVPPMPVRVQPGVSGKWRIEQFSLTPEEAEENTRSGRINMLWGGNPKSYLYDVGPGDFTRLLHDKTVVMSNTSMEVKTHGPLLSRAHGHVLVTGLGIGMAADALLKRPKVDRITVVEASEDVIALTAPVYAQDPRVEIIHADAMTWSPPAGTVYDFAWHDIWPTIDCDNLRQMETLKERFKPFARDQLCWAHMECLKQYLSIHGAEHYAQMQAEVRAQVAGLPIPKKKSLLDFDTDSLGMRV